MNIDRCPSTLVPGFTSYSPAGLRKLFDGKKVSPILPYDAPDIHGEPEEFLKNREHISISGVQEKLSVLVDQGTIRLTKSGEQGTHLLKPISSRLARASDMPANEHVTMQIAAQLFGISTAPNGLCFFQTGEPAYITRRFDITQKGSKLRKEDFASLAGKTSAQGGSNFKYDYSYLEMGELIQRYVPAWKIEMERFFRLVLFNYLFSNGDAHLKNFSVLETPQGDMTLSPAYDLLNTSLHIQDSDFALSGGLFRGASTHTNRNLFEEFGRQLGMQDKRIRTVIDHLMKSREEVETLVKCSFLSPPTKRAYMLSYRTRYNTLR
ncbi:phosphatidylinositol kinase [Akkermansia muciniphila]|uniref:type II toxin-antitoxin system HipA family toxin n=1 Tax=Akkermansia muciniphila TaxID=239935 RepID=UPI00138E8A4E|nr:HipA domain-containing protein [Akkermansia muciniphila]QHV47852.1 phosphatidylinositol kinase [Akkermansia muciniphila]